MWSWTHTSASQVQQQILQRNPVQKKRSSYLPLRLSALQSRHNHWHLLLFFLAVGLPLLPRHQQPLILLHGSLLQCHFSSSRLWPWSYSSSLPQPRPQAPPWHTHSLCVSPTSKPYIDLGANVYAYPSPTMPPPASTPHLLRPVRDNSRERSLCLQME